MKFKLLTKYMIVRIAAVAVLAIVLFFVFQPRLTITSNGYMSFSIGEQRVEAAGSITVLGTEQKKELGAIQFTYAEGLVADAGDWIIVAHSGDTSASIPGNPYFRDYSEAKTYDFTMDAQADNTGNVVTEIWSIELPVNTASNDFILVSDSADTAKAVTIYKVTGLDASPKDRTSTATGSSTTSNSGATATLSQADEIVIGAVGNEDEIDDMTGTWTTGAGYVSGNEQADGTNGAGDASNVNIYSAAEIVSATTAQTAEVSGHDDVDWGACIVTYKVAAGYSITNDPDSEGIGVVADSETYYAYGSAPSNPVQDGECTFTITNNGSLTFDIDMSISDFTGGTTWNIVSGSPSSNEVRITAYYSGQNPASGLILSNTPQEFYDALAASGTLKWDFKMETGVLTDEPNQHTATITITAVAED